MTPSLVTKTPKISIVTTNKNGARFLRETIESVMMQNYTDYEYIIVDGASTDDSLNIIKSYPHIRWISEPDSSASDGFRKGFSMARGDFIMVMSVSDIYLSRTWFRRCVELLDGDIEVSLVWGNAISMNEDGDINSIWEPAWLSILPPQKKGFLSYMFATGGYLPELNYCVRRSVFLDCFTEPLPHDPLLSKDLFLVMPFNFTVKGYLPYYLPIIAHCGRKHAGQLSETALTNMQLAHILIRRLQRDYLLDLIFGRKTHHFLDGNSNIIGLISLTDRLFLPLNLVRIKWNILVSKIFRSQSILKKICF
jgi:glycosyltransferase involved in cell wall biosynthesis